MSTVTERRQAVGSFTIDLADDCPPEIRRRLHLTPGTSDTLGFAVAVVTDVRVDPADFPAPATPATTPHPLLSVARWAGVILDVGDRRRSISGEGLAALIHDSRGIGPLVVDLADKRARASASTLVDRIISGGTLPDVLNTPPASDVDFPPSPLRVGTIHPTPAVLTIGDQLLTVGTWLRDIASTSGRRSWRVRPTGHVDFGTRAQLWPGPPRAIIGYGLPAADDPRWITVRTDGTWTESVAAWANRAYGDQGPTEGGSASSPGARAAPASTPPASYWSPIRVAPAARHIEVPFEADETATAWRTRATDAIPGELTWEAPLTGSISGNTRLDPGEPVLLWDPEVGLTDPTNPVTFGGTEIHPVRVDLAAVTWPITPGMGVYVLHVDTTVGAVQRVLDLTPYVEFSTADARLEVGAASRTL